MENIVLSLSVDEVNLIVAALSKQPFDMVFPVISNIDRQIAAQRQQLAEEPEEN